MEANGTLISPRLAETATIMCFLLCRYRGITFKQMDCKKLMFSSARFDCVVEKAVLDAVDVGKGDGQDTLPVRCRRMLVDLICLNLCVCLPRHTFSLSLSLSLSLHPFLF